ncbi:MAG: tetratricopeptide repeat protein [Armatimonadota bacterium]
MSPLSRLMRSSALFCLAAGVCLPAALPALGAVSDWQRRIEAARVASLDEDYDRAERELKAALKLSERFPPRDPRRAEVHEELASVAWSREDFQTAEREYRTALKLRERLLGSRHPSLEDLLLELAEFLEHQDRRGEAEPLLERVLKLKQQRLAAGHHEINEVLGDLALCHLNQDELEEAERYARQSLRGWEGISKQSYDTSDALDTLALVHEEQERYAEAVSLQKRRLAILKKLPDYHADERPQAAQAIARLYYAQEDWPEAEKYYREELRLLRENGPDSYGAALALATIADLRFTQEDYAEAKVLYEQSLRHWEELGANPRDYLQTVHYLGESCAQLNQFAEAERHFQRALTIADKDLGAEHDDTKHLREDLRLAQLAQGKLGAGLGLTGESLTPSQRKQMAFAGKVALFVVGGALLVVAGTVFFCVLYLGRGRKQQAGAGPTSRPPHLR